MATATVAALAEHERIYAYDWRPYADQKEHRQELDRFFRYRRSLAHAAFEHPAFQQIIAKARENLGIPLHGFTDMDSYEHWVARIDEEEQAAMRASREAYGTVVKACIDAGIVWRAEWGEPDFVKTPCRRGALEGYVDELVSVGSGLDDTFRSFAAVCIAWLDDATKRSDKDAYAVIMDFERLVTSPIPYLAVPIGMPEGLVRLEFRYLRSLHNAALAVQMPRMLNESREAYKQRIRAGMLQYVSSGKASRAPKIPDPEELRLTDRLLERRNRGLGWKALARTPEARALLSRLGKLGLDFDGQRNTIKYIIERRQKQLNPAPGGERPASDSPCGENTTR